MELKDLMKEVFIESRSEFDKIPSRCESAFEDWYSGIGKLIEVKYKLGIWAKNKSTVSDDSHGALTGCKLAVNQKVKRNYVESWDYWISEVSGDMVLIRTTERIDDPSYDDFWVSVNDIHAE